MKPNAQIVLAALLLIMSAACHRDNKEAQLKALDEAYQSGVFTKEEYDAKKQALVGQTSTAPAAPVAAASPVPPAAANPPAAPPSDTIAAPPVVAAPPVAPPPAPVQAAPPVRSSPVPPPAPVPAAAPLPAPIPAPEPVEPEPAPTASCQDSESRAGGPAGVQERFFPVSVDVVRQAALRAFTTLDFTVHSSTGDEIEASKKRHLSALVGAGGEKVTLHFSSAREGGQSGTKVTGETKKSITGRLTQKSWTGAVLAQIACNLSSGR